MYIAGGEGHRGLATASPLVFYLRYPPKSILILKVVASKHQNKLKARGTTRGGDSELQYASVANTLQSTILVPLQWSHYKHFGMFIPGIANVKYTYHHSHSPII